MESKDIIKVLECCGYDEDMCLCCPIAKECESNEFILEKKEEILDLIKNQQAENERLKKEVKKCKEHYKMACSERNEFLESLENAKAEAYKEFADRLKEKYTTRYCQKEPRYVYSVLFEDIDNLLQELTERKEDGNEII